MATDCVFCRIIKKEIPAKPVLETEHSIVINDIHPKAPVHYLILPKAHIEHMGVITPDTVTYIADLALCVAQLSKSLPIGSGFNLISNNGAAAGQSVFHLHWHFLAGRNIYEGGLNL
jgi:histidine triad (HIT) family protein